MKLFSQFSLTNLRTTVCRFPLSVALCVFFSGLTIFAVQTEWEGYLDSPAWILLIMGVFLSFDLKLFGERSANFWVKNMDWLTIPLLLLYFFLLPKEIEDMTHSDIARMFVLCGCIVLVMPFAPFLLDKRRNVFWQFFKTLGIEQLVSVFFSMVLYGGFALSLLSIDYLFNAELTHKPYLELFICISGIFYPIYFFSKVPRDYDALEADEEIGKVIKIFGLYILLPIVCTYAVILYAYMAKILFLFELPQGWVSYLVISFAVVGMFALMVIHPFYLKGENRLATIYSKCFFWVLIPVLVLLYVSIFRRLSDYSFTVNRYFILITALWITGMTIYMLYSRIQYIKPILISLVVVALFAVIGPWSAFPVSEYIQFNRLKEKLADVGLLQNGKAIKSDEAKKLSFEDRKEISSMVDYMVDYHQLESLQPLFSQPLDSIDYPSAIVDQALGLEYVARWETTAEKELNYEYFGYYSNNYVVKIDNSYDYLLMLSGMPDSVSVLPEMEDVKCKLAPNGLFSVYRGTDTLYNVTICPMYKQLSDKYGANTHRYSDSVTEMVFNDENDKCRIQLVLYSFSGQDYSGDSIKVNDARGCLMLKLK